MHLGRTEAEYKLMLLAFLMCFFGAVGSSLLYGIYDSGQLLYNILPQLNLIIGVLILKRIDNVKNMEVIVVFLFLITLSHIHYNHKFNLEWTPDLYNKHEDRFKVNCIDYLDQINKTPVVAYAMNDQSYSNGPLMARYNIPCYFLQFASKGCYFIDVNLHKAFRNKAAISPIEMSLSDISELMVFLGGHVGESDMEKLQAKFLKDSKCNFIFLQHGAKLEFDLDYYFITSIIAKDLKTGDLLLKITPRV